MDDEYVFLHLGLSFGNGPWMPVPDARREFVHSAARRQLAMLLEAAVVTECVAMEQFHRSVRPTAKHELLAHAARIAGGALTIPSDDLVRETARDWLREEPWTTRTYVEEARAKWRRLITDLASA